jgi:hypothetical protein
MTTPVPPPALLKKFSAQAQADSNKRNGPGFHKAFATYCIEWAMEKLNSKPTPNPTQIRSSDITPPRELVQQWNEEAVSTHFPPYGYSQFIATRAAQWGADQELEACCEWLQHDYPNIGANALRAARRPKPPSLKEQALAIMSQESWSPEEEDIIRCALEALPND